MCNEPLISVIIPLYNMERHIERCLNSIVNQQSENIEIIIIDDGSTDKSKQIIDDYARNEPKICVIHQENKGVSAARNAGLKVMKGKYFTFVDADDWVESTLFCDLAKIILNNDFDVVIFSGYYNTMSQQFVRKNIFDKFTVLEEKDHAWVIATAIGFCNENENRDVVQFGWVASKIYRQSLLGSVHFDETISLGEDSLFTISMLKNAKKVAYVPKRYYHYYIHSQSATHKYQPDVQLQVERMLEKMNTIIKDYLCIELIKQAFFQHIINKMNFCFDACIVNQEGKIGYIRSRDKFFSIINSLTFKNAIRGICLSRLNKKNRLKVAMLRLKQASLLLFLLLLKRKVKVVCGVK